MNIKKTYKENKINIVYIHNNTNPYIDNNINIKALSHKNDC